MNKTAIVFLLVGIAAGTGIGFGLSQTKQPAPVILEPKEPGPEALLLAEQNTRLNAALSELEKLSAEIKTTLTETRQLEAKAARYDRLLENWTVRGNAAFENLSYKPGMLIPHNELAVFLGFSDAQMQQMTDLANQTMNAVKAAEKKELVLMGDSESTMIYDIAPLPNSLQQNYEKALEKILSENQVTQLKPAITKAFLPFNQKRMLTISTISPEQYSAATGKPTKTEMLKIEEKCLDSKGNVTAKNSSVIPFDGSQGMPARWDHIFDE